MSFPTVDQICDRIWQQDVSLWTDDPDGQEKIAKRLGWLDSVQWSLDNLEDMMLRINKVKELMQIDNVILLGMGGSSLAPLVFSKFKNSEPGDAKLWVLDSTAPEAILGLSDIDLNSSLFLVSSKSGTTIETMDLYEYFLGRMSKMMDSPQERFVAITDADSELDVHASESGFADVFRNPSNIGGRYSALSYFGLVPAALIGIDVRSVLNNALEFSNSCRTTEQSNPGLKLGVLMGKAWQSGKSKLCLKLDSPLQCLGLWVEQLVAESTGKQGKGILPVLGNRIIESVEDEDCIDIYVATNPLVGEQEQQWCVPHVEELGAEFFRWEFATAVAAVYMQVNPFDEPNVAEAKSSTREFISTRRLLSPDSVYSAQSFSMSGTLTQVENLRHGFDLFSQSLQAEDYIAVLAYLPETDSLIHLLEEFCWDLHVLTQRIVTLGLGPRYLHSTGQLHKGGPDNGHFVQLIQGTYERLPIPNRDYGFSDLIRAQADGDYDVLKNKSRPIIRIEMTNDPVISLQEICAQISEQS